MVVMATRTYDVPATTTGDTHEGPRRTAGAFCGVALGRAGFETRRDPPLRFL